MLHVSDDLLIGRGHKRLVFVHPDDASRCLKILNPKNLPSDIRGRKSWATRFRPVRSFDNNYLETREYERLARRGNGVAPCFPMIHGMVETNCGPALVQDLVRNSDGNVSVNLQAFLQAFAEDQETLSRLRPAVADFAALLLSSRAVVHDLHTINTVVQERNGSLR